MTQATTQGEEELQQNDPLWMELWTMVDSTGFPSVEVDFERLFDFIKERDNIHEVELTKARLENHANVSYSPYVDTFQYYDRCAMGMSKADFHKLNKYESMKKVVFYTDKDGTIMLLEIDNLHADDIALITQLKKGEQYERSKLRTK